MSELTSFLQKMDTELIVVISVADKCQNIFSGVPETYDINMTIQHLQNYIIYSSQIKKKRNVRKRHKKKINLK